MIPELASPSHLALLSSDLLVFTLRDETRDSSQDPACDWG